MYLLVLSTSMLALSLGKVCDEYQYYDLKLSQCMQCKICKQFEWTVSECWQNNDTVCVSLYPYAVRPPSVEEIQEHLKGISFNNLPHKKAETKAKDEEASVPDTKNNITNWRTLSYALTAVLGLLAVVTTFILVLLWKKRRCVIKQYDDVEIRQGDDMGIGNEYVVFQRCIPTRSSYDEENSGILPRPIRGSGLIDINVRKYSRYYRKRLYKPIRRLLPEGVDDVFESEDSNGSRSLRLDTIPERSDSDIDDVLNADNKRQSSGKSDSEITGRKKSTNDSPNNNKQNVCSTSQSNLKDGSQIKDFSSNDEGSSQPSKDVDTDSANENSDENSFGSYVTLRQVDDNVTVDKE